MLKLGLGLEWDLGLGCGYLYQYSGGVQWKYFLVNNFRES